MTTRKPPQNDDDDRLRRKLPKTRTIDLEGRHSLKTFILPRHSPKTGLKIMRPIPQRYPTRLPVAELKKVEQTFAARGLGVALHVVCTCSPPISTTGFALQKGESKIITAPTSWGGRLWGRTLCSLDSTGNFTCLTGDCGSGKLECSGFGKPPATLAEFTLDGGEGLDFFDVSLVDGYNLPMLVVPKGGTGQNCTTIGCVTDLNDSCPSELKVTSSGTEGTSVGCKSACEAFGQPQYCCSGAYATPDVCKPSTYSQRFKSACPQAYSYAYDDRTSTFTCASADYTITFCPTPNTSKKASQGQITASTPKTTTTETPSVNSAMIYEGALGESNASPHTRGQVSGSHAIVAALSIALAIWRSWHCRALF